jgi:hypothetical protein
LPQADARGQHAEQHEVKDIGRHHADGDAVDALAGEVLVVDQLAPARAGMFEQAREDRTGQRIDHESNRDQGQRPAHAATRGLEQQHQQDRAHRDVECTRIADTKGQVVEDIRDVQHRQRDRERKQPIDPRHAAGRPRTACGSLHVGARRMAEREHDEDQAEHEGQVHPAVRGLAQQTEAGRVVVEARQRDQQHLEHGRRRRPGEPEAHVGVELLLELGDRAVVDRGAAHPGPLGIVFWRDIHVTRGRAPCGAPPSRVRDVRAGST